MSITETTEQPVKTLTPADTLGEGFGAIVEAEVEQEAVSVTALFEDEVDRVNVPDCFNYEHSRTKKWEIALWKGECLDCDALVQGGEISGLKQRCHYTQGNANCPGKETQLVFVGLKFASVDKFNRAKASGDPAKVMLALQKIQEIEDEHIRHTVMREIGLIS